MTVVTITGGNPESLIRRIQQSGVAVRILVIVAGVRAALEGVLDEGFVWAGQIVGLINDLPSARELIERTVRESWEITQNMQRIFGSGN